MSDISVPADVRELLDSEAERINNPSFIDSDPVQFPRRFSRLQDVEITAFLSAIIAWGNRKMNSEASARSLLPLMREATHLRHRRLVGEMQKVMCDVNGGVPRAVNVFLSTLTRRL